jgi:hypothetical protein
MHAGFAVEGGEVLVKTICADKEKSAMSGYEALWAKRQRDAEIIVSVGLFFCDGGRI